MHLLSIIRSTFFIQPLHNGTSAAIQGQVRDDLQPYFNNGNITRQDEAFKTYYSILDGEYDLEKVKESERPFYSDLQHVVDTDDNMARNITYKEYHQYMKRLPNNPNGPNRVQSGKRCRLIRGN